MLWSQRDCNYINRTLYDRLADFFAAGSFEFLFSFDQLVQIKQTENRLKKQNLL